MKLWSGRFEKDTDALMDALNASIDFDQRMYREDITGSIAHATMLGKTGILDPAEAETICQGLKDLLADIEAGKVEFTRENEDIHMNVEALLTARIGSAASSRREADDDSYCDIYDVWVDSTQIRCSQGDVVSERGSCYVSASLLRRALGAEMALDEEENVLVVRIVNKNAANSAD